MRNVSLVAGAIVGLAGTMSLATASHLARFEIRDVHVEGNVALNGRLVSAAASAALYDGHLMPFSKTSTLFYSQRTIEQALTEALPRLADSQVAVTSFEGGTLLVEVVERTPYALWCRNGQCYLLDERGFIFAPHKKETLVRDEIFYGGILDTNPIGMWFLPTYFNDMIRMIELIEKNDVHVVSTEVLNEHEYRMELGQGVLITARFDDDPEVVAQNFKSALSSEALTNRLDELQYIDLRFPERVYYK